MIAGARHRCMPPHVQPNCRVLILGSLPGAVSLAQSQYYAHPRNQFWPIMGSLLRLDLMQLDYPARIAAINARGVGLWDCIASAERKGSLDGAIRETEANELSAFCRQLPDLRVVAFNGATAARIGRVQLAGTAHFALLGMPSTSPAYTVPMMDKLAFWRGLSPFLIG